MIRMDDLKAITTVYSYYFPETKQVIDRLVKKFPHDVYDNAIPKQVLNHSAYDYKLHGLDDFHKPIVRKYIARAKDVQGLKNFSHSYPTNGSSEGIFHYLTHLRMKGIDRIYMFKGDYEGYREYAKMLNIDVIEVNGTQLIDGVKSIPVTLKNIGAGEPGVWFISNPSAINGNIIPNSVIEGICDAGHKVFYDLTYVGMTRPYKFQLGHPNIIGACVSFSKPFGMFYHRCGFLFSNEEIPSLYGNKWFKNIFGLMVADKMMDKYDLHYFYKKYQSVQASIVEGIADDLKINIVPSDVLILANIPVIESMPSALKIELSMFKRHEHYRFCLTPYFMDFENKKKKKKSPNKKSVEELLVKGSGVEDLLAMEGHEVVISTDMLKEEFGDVIEELGEEQVEDVVKDVPRVKAKRSGDTIIVSKCPYCDRSHFHTKGERDNNQCMSECGKGQYIFDFEDVA